MAVRAPIVDKDVGAAVMTEPTKQPWLKFFTCDWRGDLELGPCSLAARGLWMEMLCIMSDATPRGSLKKDDEPYTTRRLAALARAPVKEVERLLAELEAEGVFSRDPDGTIFSRRMRRDIKKAETDRKNGGLGGNPKLKKRHKRGVNPADKPEDKAQKPEARSQKPDISSLRSDAETDAICDRFFAAYPRFDEPDGVRRELLRILDDGVVIDDIEAGAKRYAKTVAGKEGQFIAAPMKWLRDGRWKAGTRKAEQPEKPIPGCQYADGWLTAMDSAQGRSWAEHRGRGPWCEAKTWYFPSEWPPGRSAPADHDVVEHAA